MARRRKQMTKKDFDAFTHFLKAFKYNWDANSYYREAYDQDLEYYLGYRDEGKYPLSFNMSVNKLLPRVHTVLSQFMEQLYQGGSHNLVGVRARKKQDLQRVARVEGLLNFQLETLNDIDVQGSSFGFNFQWLFNAITFGKGIAKQYWRKEERIGPRRITMPMPKFDPTGQRIIGIEMMDHTVQEMQTCYEGPYAEVLHNKLCVPNPFYKSIQQMPFFGVVYSRSVDYINRMAKEGKYRNVHLMGWSGDGTGSLPGYGHSGEDSGERFAKSIEIEKVMAAGNMESDRLAPEVDVLEMYGKYIFPEDESPYEVGSGYKIKGKESEAIAHIANYKTLLSVQKNEYGIRPFFDIGCYHHPEMFWDLGFIRLGKEIQEQYNNLANTRFQNALQMSSMMLKVRQDADIDPEALIWKPFGIVPVEEMDDVQTLATPDVSQTGAWKEQQQFFEETLSDMIGVYPYGMGQTPPRQEHVGTVQSIQQMGMSRMKLIMMLADYQGFQPFLKHMMRLNTFHLPPGYETRVVTKEGDGFEPLFSGDLHVDWDFTARYTAMEPALAKQFKAQQLIQLSGMWQDNPYLNQYNWTKAIMELMDQRDTDKLLTTPEELQQQQAQQMEQQAQQQMQMMAQQQQIADKQHSHEISKEVVKAAMK